MVTTGGGGDYPSLAAGPEVGPSGAEREAAGPSQSRPTFPGDQYGLA
jgi:hypothetical protein